MHRSGLRRNGGRSHGWSATGQLHAGPGTLQGSLQRVHDMQRATASSRPPVQLGACGYAVPPNCAPPTGRSGRSLLQRQAAPIEDTPRAFSSFVMPRQPSPCMTPPENSKPSGPFSFPPVAPPTAQLMIALKSDLTVVVHVRCDSPAPHHTASMCAAHSGSELAATFVCYQPYEPVVPSHWSNSSAFYHAPGIQPSDQKDACTPVTPTADCCLPSLHTSQNTYDWYFPHPPPPHFHMSSPSGLMRPARSTRELSQMCSPAYKAQPLSRNPA